MFSKIICVIILIAGSVLCRNVPNFSELDEEDKILFRAAYDSYDTQPYNHDNYDNEIPISKFDLLKDGMWALKAKINELKVFNKALAANLLSTKLHLKEMMAHLKPLKKHQHVEIDKKHVYRYQPESSPPPLSYSQYDPPHPQHTAPAPSQHYTDPAPQYSAQHYGSPQPAHDPYYGN